MPPDELELERAHLAAARADLARMRERTSKLDSAAAGDWVSQIILESSMAARMKALEDDPTVPLFFGRVDYDQGHPEAGHPFYIGRRHVSDESGDPMVVDWRAPISLPFYRASGREPMGVRLRRRFGFHRGQVTAFEDEALTAGGAQEFSQILQDEIERPRVGPMRDIVATIQPEQDLIVRADLATSLCVQGAPGTGKTAVGLHRAAFLLYAYREQLGRQGVLVVGPNQSFLRYIADVLPALGEIDAEQATIESLVAKTLTRLNQKYAVRGTDPAEVAALKGDARMAAVVDRAVWRHLRTPEEGLVVPRGSRRWRLATYEVEEILAELRDRGVRYGAARTMLPHRLAHALLVKMEESGETPDDRVQDAVARSQPVKKYAAQVWPTVDPAKLVHRLLSDPVLLAEAGAGLLDADEQAAVLWPKPSRSAGTAPWSLADAVLIDEATDVVDRTASLGHVVVDEAQDLSPMMLRAVGRRCTTGSVTVLGDLAQATTAWASTSWQETMRHLGKPGAAVEELTRGYRVPGEVIDLAARLLPVIAPDLAPPTSVRRSRGELRFARTDDPTGEVVSALRGWPEDKPGSIGVIVADATHKALADALAESVPAGVLDRTEIIAATLAKGLEFDHVMLVEPAAIVAGEPTPMIGLRRLYVCLTRAVTSLVVVHAEGLPAELGLAG